MVALTPKFAFLAIFALCATVSATPVEVKRGKPLCAPLTRHRVPGATASSKRSSIGAREGSAPATNLVQLYTAPVQVGTQTFNLLIDTGSSAIWFGGGAVSYVAGPTSVNLGVSFAAAYASGFAEGNGFNDTVTIGGYAVKDFPVGNATFVSVPVLNGGVADGILGVGPVDLTKNVFSGSLGSSGFDTFQVVLKKQSGIPNIVGIYFKPESGSDNDDTNGEITYGGIDSTKFTGDITYVPVTTVNKPIFDYYWSVDVAAMSVGSTVIQSTSLPALVDTGTTWLMLPYDSYQAFLTATGGEQGPFGYSSWVTPPTETLTISIGGTNFTLTPEQYLITPEQLPNWDNQLGYPDFKFDPTLTWSWIMNGGPDDGFNLNFILGQKFLEYYYSVYDGDNNRIGFAPNA